MGCCVLQWQQANSLVDEAAVDDVRKVATL
jgi:hypothetical protein